MIVCVCQGVCDRTIERLLLLGADTVEALASRCGAGTDCGACQPFLTEMIEERRGSVYPADTLISANAVPGGAACEATIRSSAFSTTS